MAKALQLPAISPFDVNGDQTSVSQRWDKWKKTFEFYLTASGITDKAQKRALFLHSAGSEVQEIFDTLGDTGDDLEGAKTKLDEYFQPKRNIAFERHLFRNAAQGETEKIDSFVTRLRKLAVTCEFEKPDDNIRDQIVEKCKSSKLRKRLLKEKELTLKNAMDIARAGEIVDEQADRFKGSETFSNSDVNTVRPSVNHPKRYGSEKSSERDVTCFRCGRKGHIARNCTITKDKNCNKCGKKGHFAKVCKTKSDSPRTKPGRDRSTKHVHLVQSESSEDQFAFAVHDKYTNGMIDINVGGATVQMLIDSGATCNIVNSDIWSAIRANNESMSLSRNTKRLFSYGSKEPLQILGTFQTVAKYGLRETSAEFAVVKGDYISLLGKDTAVELGVLRIGVEGSDFCSVISEIDKIVASRNTVFDGVGKLKNFQLRIHVDKTVTPVAQPLRRLPFNVRKSVNKKLEELEKMDIIEKVNNPTAWVSPLVVVPKKNGEIRICVDMRRANTAVQRERYPIPTVDEMLEDMNGSKVFSKLDLRWGYHQIELDEESREITTFVTHEGLYRYKRLMFGISSASEIYQRVIGQVIQGIEGVRNLSDDIIVYGTDEVDHNRKLTKVLDRLAEKGLTLNREKCKFGLSKIVFLGHVISSEGIRPDQEKVQAVSETRTPTNSSEIRSFLGLANYCGRFIPNFSTIAAPLRELTRKSTHWRWTQKHQDAFDMLKKALASAEALAYYNPKAETRIIVDASPVGLGAILAQKQPDGLFKPIAYSSRSLTDVEQRYSQTEREALGVVFGCEKFHMYIYGLEFEIWTDHKPLTYIYSPKSKPPARIERWILRLQPYKYKIVYIPGPKNAADALSRLSRNRVGRIRHIAEEYAYFIAENAVPKALTIQEVRQKTSEDPELAEIMRKVKTGNGRLSPKFRTVEAELSVVDGIVLRGSRIILPKCLRRQTVSLAHEGHQGIVRTKQRLREKVWWPGIDIEAERFVRACHQCQLLTNSNRPEPVRTTVLPDGPWQDLAIDLMGPFPSGEYLLVVIDYFSRFQEVAIMKKITSERIIFQLESMFARHGLPYSMRSDNGPQFVSEEFKGYLDLNGIKHIRTTPYWPQGNGEVERQNRTLLKAIKAANAERKDWRRELPKFLLAYRTTPHSTTGKSPAELLYNRKIHTKLPEMSKRIDHQELRETDARQKFKFKRRADERRGAVESKVEIGDTVVQRQPKRDKLSTEFAPEKFVVREKCRNAVTLEDENGSSVKRNCTAVKKFISNRENETESREPEISAEESGDESDKDRSVTDTVRPSREHKPPAYLRDYVTT
ncbi:uncharacterized protein K02A2.6-like [Ostrea edulis]|uniref:uncharacterized protein K02A2.6-like n=1 Tax=Ostrea edulis TaxID=37623 RepID=UPI0024AEC3AC|nr:uncharacterized protein K02A2.6-like [Ostrea edulis]